MALLRWDERFLTGQAQIDSEHQHLFELANGFYDGFMLDHDRDHVLGLLDSLVDHVKRHFAYEESLMEETGYASLDDHREQHQKLLEQVTELHHKFRDRAANPTHNDVKFLSQLLGNHIRHEDRALALHLRDLQKSR